MADTTFHPASHSSSITPVTLPNLPYAEEALEPFISAETLHFHHDKHHRKYVEETNRLLGETPELAGLSLEDIIRQADGPLFNNAAQAWNHTFFWNCLTPRSKQQPSARLREKLSEAFGSYTDFKDQFSEHAVKLFGSGWTWLSVDETGELVIEAMKDADNPLSLDHRPLLTLDVWEHAYYVDYRNDRAKFIENFWHIVNWDFVESNCFEKH